MNRNRVLVIDDDPDLRDLVAVLLADLGLEAVSAGSCQEALPLIERERGRLRAVLLDYYMPGLAPRDCVRAIASQTEAEVPVVLMSAAVDVGARARELGLASFLAKPFEAEELGRAIGV
jgi:CheY-like chemotaxis protein